MKKKKALVLGGSRGLGRAISLWFETSLEVSRTTKESIDFSKSDSVEKVMNLVEREKPEVIFYNAGGGPHGEYFSKSIKSHQWAYQVNHFTPVALVYELIEKKYEGVFVYIGSAIAERSNSSQSLSYSFSKKMSLKTLLSIPDEDLKIRVFSPPYMNTGLLPKNAWPRLEAPELVLEPDIVAEKIMEWLGLSQSSEGDCVVRHFDWIQEFDYNLPENREI